MPPKQNISFFVGLYEIGDYTLTLSKGLRQLGFSVSNVVWELESPILERKEKHDRYIKRTGNKYLDGIKLLGEFPQTLLHNDVFIFNFCLSFTGSWQHSNLSILRSLAYTDLAILKALGKKSVIIVNGDDLRSRQILIQEMQRAGLEQHAKWAAQEMQLDLGISDEIKRFKAAKLEKYATHIFAHPDTAQFLTKNYHHFWIPIDLSALQFNVKSSDTPLVIHAPSETKIKGTKSVIEAVNKLKQEGYKFEFELCQNMSNIELKNKLAQSQITIDQLFLPSYGLLAIEAMALGNAVLGSAVPGYNGFSDDLPILTTTPENIYDNLKDLLENPLQQVDLAYKGRKYVEKYHDLPVVTRDFVSKIGLSNYL